MVVRFLRAIVLSLVILLLVFAVDYGVVRYRMARGRNPFGQVTVKPYYAIQEKGGKIEYQFAAPETATCVHSLFPHMGYSPCWYLVRHTEKRIDI